MQVQRGGTGWYLTKNRFYSGRVGIKKAFDRYCNDTALIDLHRHRENGMSNYVWHLFARLKDFRPILKDANELSE